MWNTGPRWVTTIHANTAISALHRKEQLAAEVSQTSMQEVIGEAVDLVVSIGRTPEGRWVREVIHVEAYRDGQYQIETSSGKEMRMPSVLEWCCEHLPAVVGCRKFHSSGCSRGRRRHVDFLGQAERLCPAAIGEFNSVVDAAAGEGAHG